MADLPQPPSGGQWVFDEKTKTFVPASDKAAPQPAKEGDK